MKHTQLTDHIWIIDSFLSRAACDELILFSEMNDYEEAKISLPGGEQMVKSVRNNDRLIFDDQNLADRLWERLKPYCPAMLGKSRAIGLNERFRFYRYTEGQQFKMHRDGSFRRNFQEQSRITFMIYLNDDFEGGSTHFRKVDVQPKTGTALCFIHDVLHEGTTVKSGTKYVLRSDVMYHYQEVEDH